MAGGGLAVVRCSEPVRNRDFACDNACRMPRSFSQPDKFKEAARELGADEDERRWEERLKRVAKTKDVPAPPTDPLRSKPNK